MIIYVDDCGPGEVYVYFIEDDGETRTNDGCFVSRANAEEHAERLAKLHGCEWETNYCPF